MKSKFITVLLIFSLFGETFAQVYSDKVVGAKNEELADSIKKSDYPYLDKYEKVTNYNILLHYSNLIE